MEIGSCVTAEAWSWVWIGKNLWNMPSGIGSLVGAAIGLLAVAWAARRGFKHLIKSQEHQAELNRQRDDRLRAEERKTVAIEIQAAIVALMSHAIIAERTINTARVRGAAITPASLIALEIPQSVFPPDASQRVGLLGPDLCFRTTQAYVANAVIRQDYASLRAEKNPAALNGGKLKAYQDNFAMLVRACQRADRALAAFTGKSFKLPPGIEPPG